MEALDLSPLEVEEIYRDKKIIVVKKPVGVPSQSDPTCDLDMMTLTSRYLSARGERPELWLVHRLDRNVGGLIVFARSKPSAAELSALIADGALDKYYFAVCDGICEGGEYRDFLFKDSSTNKSYVVNSARKGAKEAILTATPLAVNDGKTLLLINLKTGRFHQIRAQLSSRGFSLTGDKKYGSRDRGAKYPALFACRLGFMQGKEKKSFSSSPDLNLYPWCLFDKELY